MYVWLPLTTFRTVRGKCHKILPYSIAYIFTERKRPCTHTHTHTHKLKNLIIQNTVSLTDGRHESFLTIIGLCIFAFLSAVSFLSFIHMRKINLMKLNHLKNMFLTFPRALLWNILNSVISRALHIIPHWLLCNAFQLFSEWIYHSYRCCNHINLIRVYIPFIYKVYSSLRILRRERGRSCERFDYLLFVLPENGILSQKMWLE